MTFILFSMWWLAHTSQGFRPLTVLSLVQQFWCTKQVHRKWRTPTCLRADHSCSDTACPRVSSLRERLHFDLIQRWRRSVWHRGLNTILPHRKREHTHTHTHNYVISLGHSVRLFWVLAMQTMLPKQESGDMDYQQGLCQLQVQFREANATHSQQFELRADLAFFRKQLAKSSAQRDPTFRKTHANEFKNWTCLYVHRFTCPSDHWESAIYACKSGPRISHLALQWLGTLEWPAQQNSNFGVAGITWIDLCLNFWLLTQTSNPIPIQRLGDQVYEH